MLFGCRNGGLRRGGPIELSESACFVFPERLTFGEAACVNIVRVSHGSRPRRLSPQWPLRAWPSHIRSPELTFGVLASQAFNTAYNALIQQGRVQAGEIMLVLGATGGTGLAAVQMGKAAGMHVIAVGSSDAKLEAVKSQGADFVINSTTHMEFSGPVNEWCKQHRTADRP